MNTTAPMDTLELYQGQGQIKTLTLNQARHLWQAGQLTASDTVCWNGSTGHIHTMPKIMAALDAAPAVHVGTISPVAMLTAPIPGRAAGNLTLIGKCGVLCGLLSLILVAVSPPMAAAGVLLGVASFLWLRRVD